MDSNKKQKMNKMTNIMHHSTENSIIHVFLMLPIIWSELLSNSQQIKFPFSSV